jgi:hypothetical protein
VGLEVFNIAEKYKPQLQCNKSDKMYEYMDIKWDSSQVDWHILQKNLFTDIMTSSADTFTPKSQPPAAHYYVSTVHDIASDSEHSIRENSCPVFVRQNTLTSIQLELTKSFIKHFE